MKVLKYQFKSFEKMPTRIWKDASEASIHVARSIALAMRQNSKKEKISSSAWLRVPLLLKSIMN